MKIDNQHIQDLAKKLFHHRQGFDQIKLVHPRRDWVIGVIVGAIIICLMAGWSVYTYLEQRQAISLESPIAEVQMPVYKAEVVEDALTIFAKRAQQFSQLTGGGVVQTESVIEVVSDPLATTTDQAASSTDSAEATAVEVTDQVIEANQPTDPVVAEPDPIADVDSNANIDELLETPTLVQ